MHKGTKKCYLNAPQGKKVKIERKKPNKGYTPKKTS